VAPETSIWASCSDPAGSAFMVLAASAAISTILDFKLKTLEITATMF
jgi:hypothetical protein